MGREKDSDSTSDHKSSDYSTSKKNINTTSVIQLPWINIFTTTVALVLASGAIYATYDVFWKSQTKRLSIDLYDWTPLVNISPEASSDIAVSYKGQPVESLSLVQVRVKNTGGQPIKPEDYIEPVELIFPETSEVAETYVVNSSPQNIGLMAEKSAKNAVTISKTLLNQEDQSSLAIILISKTASPEGMWISGRIIGVKSIESKWVINDRQNDNFIEFLGFGLPKLWLNFAAGAFYVVILRVISNWISRKSFTKKRTTVNRSGSSSGDS